MTTNSHDLLSWLKLFWTEDTDISYDSLRDGFFLNEVFREIDPNAFKNEQISQNESASEFVKNWEILTNNIRVYYTKVLQQTILVRLPSVITIFHDRNTDKTVSEINKAIFLILGAAVQCERKEYFIQDIMNRLSDESIQHGLMGFIKQITEDTETVISYVHLGELPRNKIIETLRRIADEWEASFMQDSRGAIEHIEDLVRRVTEQQGQIQILRNVLGADQATLVGSLPLLGCNGSNTGDAVNSGVGAGQSSVSNSGSHGHHSGDKQTLLELAECKARIRKLQNELDDKGDMICDLREDLDQAQDENGRLKEANTRLTIDARRVRSLQDELDVVRETLSRCEQKEHENNKLREKVGELEYYKVRCEELREDMTHLSVENTGLLDKLENSKRFEDRYSQLEMEYKKALKKIDDQDNNIASKLAEIQALNDEIFSLYEKDSVDKSKRTGLEKELQNMRLSAEGEDDGSSELDTSGRSLSEQLTEKANTRLVKMDIENRSLREQLNDALRARTSKDEAERNQSSQEIERLQQKITKLQESSRKEVEQVMVERDSREILNREKQQLEHSVELARESERRHVQQLTVEIETLNETVMALRERSEKSTDSRVCDLEKENGRLHGAVSEATHRISGLEFESERLGQKTRRLEAALDTERQEHLRLSKENAELDKEVAALKLAKTSLEELRAQFSRLEQENARLDALIGEQKRAGQRSPSESERQRQERESSVQKMGQMTAKIREIESELETERVEREKSTRVCAGLEQNLRSCQDELDSCRDEIAGFTKLESRLKLCERNREELERERETQQQQLARQEASTRLQEREIRRLRGCADAHAVELEEARTRLTETETRLRTEERMRADMEAAAASVTESESRAVDAEQKNRELYRQAVEERRKCETLREQLLTEKLGAEQLRGQLKRLREDLEQQLELPADDDQSEKYEILEEKINITLKDTMKKKEDKITDLNTKLVSALSRNKQMTVRIEEANQRYMELQHKFEEEITIRSIKSKKESSMPQQAGGDSPDKTVDGLPAYAQYLTELKDRIISLERQNAELAIEKQHSEGNASETKQKVEKLEHQLEKEREQWQQRHRTEAERSMRLEIETSTLLSQLDTLRSDNRNLSLQVSDVEKSLYSASAEAAGLVKHRDQLEQQNEQLQSLNETLSRDYESVKAELSIHKVGARTTAGDLQTTRRQLVQLQKDAESVKQLREILESEKGNFADSAQALISMRQENRSLAHENTEMVRDKAQLESQSRSLNQELKTLRLERAKDKVELGRLRDTIFRQQKKLQELELEIVKLTEKIEHLQKENAEMRENNQNVMQQMNNMLSQNHELLSETLQNKTSHFNEESHLKERLHMLQRQKERLEEKIMDQYKLNPGPKNSERKSSGAKFMKKAKELLKKKISKPNPIQERKNSVDPIHRAQRSKSCVTILDENWDDGVYPDPDRSPGTYKSSLHNSSDQDRMFDSEPSEIDSASAVDKRASRTNSDAETNSIMSSMSYQQHQNPPLPKLQPGSMSMYDRDESERRNMSDMTDFLSISNQPSHQATLPHSVSMDTASRTGSSSNNKTSFNMIHNGANRRPHSVLDQPAGFRSQQHQQHHRTTPVVPMSSSIQRGTQLAFGGIESRSTANTPGNNNSSSTVTSSGSSSGRGGGGPSVPMRHASLPVTDRAEEDMLASGSGSHHMAASPRSASGSSCGSTVSGGPGITASVASGLRKHSQPVTSVNAPTASMVPATASSKAILARLKLQHQHQLPSNNSPVNVTARVRPPTPNSQLVANVAAKSAQDSTSPSSRVVVRTHPHSSAAHPLPRTPAPSSSVRGAPSVPQGVESKGPSPPKRRESNQHHRPAQIAPQSSTATTDGKLKFYTDYGNY